MLGAADYQQPEPTSQGFLIADAFPDASFKAPAPTVAPALASAAPVLPAAAPVPPAAATTWEDFSAAPEAQPMGGGFTATAAAEPAAENPFGFDNNAF